MRLIWALPVALAGIIGAASTAGVWSLAAPVRLPHVGPAPAAGLAVQGRALFTLPPGRPVYRYSVVPGGVWSADEVLAAIANDREVADHYDAVQLDQLRPVRLHAPLAAHVSYRKDGRVRWTSHPVTLPAGELLLTDGTNAIRARCGNRLVASLDGIRDAASDPAFSLRDLDSLDGSDQRRSEIGGSQVAQGHEVPALSTEVASTQAADSALVASLTAGPRDLALIAPALAAGQPGRTGTGDTPGNGIVRPAGGIGWSPLFLTSNAAPNGLEMTELLFPSEQDPAFIDTPDPTPNPLDGFLPESPTDRPGGPVAGSPTGEPGDPLIGPADPTGAPPIGGGGPAAPGSSVPPSSGPAGQPVSEESQNGTKGAGGFLGSIPEPAASALLLVAAAAMGLRRAFSAPGRRRIR